MIALNKTLKITSYVFIFIFIFIASVFIGAGLMFLAGSTSLSEIKESIPKVYLIQSGSMEPAIKVASLVVSYPSKTYSPGDIVTFSKSNGNTITHRVDFKLYENGLDNDPVFVTSGDANEEVDQGYVAKDDIAGKVVFTLPYAGYLVDFAKTPQGFILFVIVPATIVVYEEIRFLLKSALDKLKNKNIIGLSNLSIRIPRLSLIILGKCFFCGNIIRRTNFYSHARTISNTHPNPGSY
jgi:signal peptidase